MRLLNSPESRSVYKAQVHFAGWKEDLERIRDAERANHQNQQCLVQQARNQEVLHRPLIRVGSNQLTGIELLHLFEELSQIPSSEKEDDTAILMGVFSFFTFGLPNLSQRFRQAKVRHRSGRFTFDEVYALFFPRNSTLAGEFDQAFRLLQQAGLIRIAFTRDDPIWELTPQGREALLQFPVPHSPLTAKQEAGQNRHPSAMAVEQNEVNILLTLMARTPQGHSGWDLMKTLQDVVKRFKINDTLTPNLLAAKLGILDVRDVIRPLQQLRALELLHSYEHESVANPAEQSFRLTEKGKQWLTAGNPLEQTDRVWQHLQRILSFHLDRLSAERTDKTTRFDALDTLFTQISEEWNRAERLLQLELAGLTTAEADQAHAPIEGAPDLEVVKLKKQHCQEQLKLLASWREQLGLKRDAVQSLMNSWRRQVEDTEARLKSANQVLKTLSAEREISQLIREIQALEDRQRLDSASLTLQLQSILDTVQREYERSEALLAAPTQTVSKITGKQAEPSPATQSPLAALAAQQSRQEAGPATQAAEDEN